MIAKLAHRVRAVRTIGLRKALRAWHNKSKIQKITHAWQQQDTWKKTVAPGVARLLEDDFERLFVLIKRRSFSCMHTIYASELPTTTCNQADNYVRGTIELLGSAIGNYPFMPWAVDIRLQQQSPVGDSTFDLTTYFAHMHIQQSDTAEMAKDIKVPWELSRFIYLPTIAKAYVLTGHKRYLDTIIAHMADWIDKNPFLHGPNWMNAMEVAIRAINWIATFDLIKESLPQLFAQRVVTVLYQHMVYIEHHWEYYDSRTNNHYLANLVGYLYLAHFFADMPGNKKFDWCVAELMQELDKQVFAEGTSYEGSTYYHKLVTELYLLAYVLLQEKRFIVSPVVIAQLQRMIAFLVWCTPERGNLIALGDHDSGVVMRGGLAYQKVAVIWAPHHEEKAPYMVYNEFGLSIIKTNTWHVTLRHHAYHPRQPSGHFHNDSGSITLSVDGIPIFVDPGSFVYTASAFWRNYFRSTSVHNSCSIKDSEHVALDERLFYLALPQHTFEARAYKQDDIIFMSTQHQLYKKYGLTAQRDLRYDMSEQSLTITDLWLSRIKQHTHTLVWNFTLSPDIVPVQDSKDKWFLWYKNTALVCLQSHDVMFTVQPAWVSPAYGVKQESMALCAYAGIAIDKPFVMTVHRI